MLIGYINKKGEKLPLYENPSPEEIMEAGSYGNSVEGDDINVRWITAGDHLFLFPGTAMHAEGYRAIKKYSPEVLANEPFGFEGMSKAQDGKLTNNMSGGGGQGDLLQDMESMDDFNALSDQLSQEHHIDQYFDKPYSKQVLNELESQRGLAQEMWGEDEIYNNDYSGDMKKLLSPKKTFTDEQLNIVNKPANPLDDMSRQMLEKPNIHGDAKGKDSGQYSIGKVSNNDYSSAMKKLLWKE